MESVTRTTEKEKQAALTLLDLWKFYEGKVLPFDGKQPDYKTCLKQRKTKQYKKDPNGYFLEPPTSDEVKEWQGIGLFLGEVTGLCVLDVDEPGFLMLPRVQQALKGIKTPTVKTCSGYHFYFRIPADVIELPKGARGCPLLNDKESPCYIGRGEVVSLKTGGVVALPPTGGRAYHKGFTPLDVEPAELPEALIQLLFRIPRPKRRLNVHKKNISLMDVPLKALSLMDTQKTKDLSLMDTNNSLSPMDTYPASGYGVLQVREEIKKLLFDEKSELIKKLVGDLNGSGNTCPCPYHPPDRKRSGSFTCLERGWKGWHFTCWHNGERLPIAQVVTDIYTGYINKLAKGLDVSHRHYVTSLGMEEREAINIKWKVKAEAWVWLALYAGDKGLIELPPLKGWTLDSNDWTPEEIRILRFVEKWGRASCYTFGVTSFPLAKSWLISVLFGVGNPGEIKSLEWDRAYETVDKCLSKARRSGRRGSNRKPVIRRTKQGVRGYGGSPAFYEVLDPVEHTTDGGGNPVRIGEVLDLDDIRKRLGKRKNDRG